ncbi:hypothetical protein BAE44_0004158 [Dichanthelium oligosanthes]|uniref:Uncharacterized protein n=1 Tax=Dichanthelium oligosanthes TaxID=888268 RepID=A0A1E5WBT5_9POAL|nr:hypothetical protein BAE44_0004158 [Dichanthelium oligosanthes]
MARAHIVTRHSKNR